MCTCTCTYPTEYSSLPFTRLPLYNSTGQNWPHFDLLQRNFGIKILVSTTKRKRKKKYSLKEYLKRMVFTCYLCKEHVRISVLNVIINFLILWLYKTLWSYGSPQTKSSETQQERLRERNE